MVERANILILSCLINFLILPFGSQYVKADRIGRGAVFIDQNVPDSVRAGEVFEVAVAFRNSSPQEWSSAAKFRLGSQAPRDNTVWGVARVALDQSEVIKPGDTKLFRFTLTAPDKEGTYSFQWRMVQENVAWFGNASPRKTITVNPALAKKRPLVVANYFLAYRGDAKVTGSPITYRPKELYHTVGKAEEESWASNGTAGFLSHGPYRNVPELKADLATINKRAYDASLFRVSWELQTSDNSFSPFPIGWVGILATSAVSERVIYKHALYPQDFKRSGAFQTFSLTFADYAPYWDPKTPEKNEALQFCVYYNGARDLSIGNTNVYPMSFDPWFSSWSNRPARGGETPVMPGQDRLRQPEWILTSRFNADGTVEKLPRIEWWKREITAGNSENYPFIGVYDQANKELLRYHIRQAKAAGIDAFKVYMYYLSRCGAVPTDYWTGSAFETLLDIAASENFRIYINESMIADYSANQDKTYGYADVICNLELAARRGYLNHPAYLKIDGKPVYDLPLPLEKNPALISDLAVSLNQKYNSVTGKNSGLYLSVTAVNAFYMDYYDGPYNMENVFVDQILFDRWENYFSCPANPGSITELLDKCVCRYDPSMAANTYCVFLATLLKRDHLSGFRSLNGVAALYDWTAYGAMNYPRYIKVIDGKPVWAGKIDKDVTRQAFDFYRRDVETYGYGSIIPVLPGYDTTDLYPGAKFEAIKRFEDDGSGIRFRRMIRSALDVGPTIIDIENWNGWGESVNIEPSVSFVDDDGNSDPDIYLKILAEELGMAYEAPCIPPEIIDPLRVGYIPSERLCRS